MQGPGSIDVNFTCDMAGRLISRDEGPNFTTFTWSSWDCMQETRDGVDLIYYIPDGMLQKLLEVIWNSKDKGISIIGPFILKFRSMIRRKGSRTPSFTGGGSTRVMQVSPNTAAFVDGNWPRLNWARLDTDQRHSLWNQLDGTTRSIYIDILKSPHLNADCSAKYLGWVGKHLFPGQDLRQMNNEQLPLIADFYNKGETALRHPDNRYRNFARGRLPQVSERLQLGGINCDCK